jgi:hypothetical protein
LCRMEWHIRKGETQHVGFFWAGIFKKSMVTRNRGGIGLSYRPARLHRLAEFILWNRFLGSIKVPVFVSPGIDSQPIFRTDPPGYIGSFPRNRFLCWSMLARNRIRIGSSCRPAWLRTIGWRNQFLGIDSWAP